VRRCAFDERKTPCFVSTQFSSSWSLRSSRSSKLERHDPDLARQCRRALTSSPLNVAEGCYSRGRNRNARYHTAVGSLREALACFEVATALGFMPALPAPILQRFNQVIGTLVNLAGGH
jgi:four helix bundle protein